MKVLLHICCGICASWSIEKLKRDGYEVTGFFYNPNIYPSDEYERRLQVARDVCAAYGIPLVEGAYDPGQWTTAVSGLENEPEGGARCEACYRVRLAVTAERARQMGIGSVTTTLTISPHKDAAAINKIGKSVAPQTFLEYNLKKEDGFKKANAFAKTHNLYRQHYCGCLYSMPSGSVNGR